MSQQQFDRAALVAELRVRLNRWRFRADDPILASLPPQVGLGLLVEALRPSPSVLDRYDAHMAALFSYVLLLFVVVVQVANLSFPIEATLWICAVLSSLVLALFVAVCFRWRHLLRARRAIVMLVHELHAAESLPDLLQLAQWFDQLPLFNELQPVWILRRALRRILPRCTVTEARCLTSTDRAILVRLAQRARRDAALPTAALVVLSSVDAPEAKSLACTLVSTDYLPSVRSVADEVLRELALEPEP